MRPFSRFHHQRGVVSNVSSSPKLRHPAKNTSYAIEALESRLFLSNSTLLTASNLGVVPATGSVRTTGHVGASATELFYRFSIPSSRDVTVSLNVASNSADLQFIRDANGNGLVDNGDVLEESGYTGSSTSLHQRLPAGTYFAAVIQPSGNTPFTLSVIAPTAPVDPGNTLTTAKNLGAIPTSGSVTNSDWVGSADTEDDYSFSISSSRDVTVSLHVSSNSADLQLIRDSNGNGLIDNGDILEESGYTGSSTSLHQRLPAGTYFARVIQPSGDTFYAVSVVAPSAPVDPGNTLLTAKSLGPVGTSGAVSNSDWVGSADTEDDYSFTISSIRDVTVSLHVSSNSADLQLIRDSNGNGLIDNGDILEESGYTGSSTSLHQRLPAGTYYARVIQPSGDTFYTVSVVAPAAPADPGNTLGTAKSLGAIGTSGAVTNADWVGSADTEDDYSFTISSSRDVTISLSVSSNSADLQFIRDTNGNGLIDNKDILEESGYTGSSTSLHQRLPAGTYYARVIQPSGDTFYSISVVAPSAPVDPGNTLGAATDLGYINGVTQNSDWVGSADPEDDYRFHVASSRLVTLSLQVMSNSADLQLIRDVNGNGQIDNGDVLAESGYTGSITSIQQQLPAGTYYARVIQPSGDTFYTIAISSPVVQTSTNVAVIATDPNASFANSDPGTFTLTRTGSTVAALTLDYALTGTAIDGTDYTSVPLLAVIPAGKTSVTVTITPKPKSSPTRTAVLTLTSSAAYSITPGKAAATVTISGNNLPTAGIISSDPTAEEPGIAPATTGAFTFTRSSATATGTFNFTLAGSATYGTDYTLAAYGATIVVNKVTRVLTLTLSAGKTSAILVVTPVKSEPVASSTVVLTLSAKSAFGITPGKSDATVTLIFPLI